MDDDGEFYSIIDYAVDGPDTQRELIRVFAGLQERWVRYYAGYQDSTLFASLSGDRVYNVVRWDSEAHYRRFEEDSHSDGRIAAIQASLAGLSGRAEPRMSGPALFRVARVVRSGPRQYED